MEPSNIPLRPTLARLELEAPPACQTLLPPQVEAAAPPLPACLTLPPPSAAMVVSAAAAAPRRSPYSLRLHNLLHARNGGASRVLQHSSRVTPRRTLDPGGEPLRRRQACLREGRAHHRRAGEHPPSDGPVLDAESGYRAVEQGAVVRHQCGAGLDGGAALPPASRPSRRIRMISSVDSPCHGPSAAIRVPSPGPSRRRNGTARNSTSRSST